MLIWLAIVLRYRPGDEDRETGLSVIVTVRFKEFQNLCSSAVFGSEFPKKMGIAV